MSRSSSSTGSTLSVPVQPGSSRSASSSAALGVLLAEEQVDRLRVSQLNKRIRAHDRGRLERSYRQRHQRLIDERAVRPVDLGLTADLELGGRSDLDRGGSCAPVTSNEHDAANSKHHCNERDPGTDPGIPPLK